MSLLQSQKQFAAFAIAMLVSKGKLNLNDDIRKHLPELPKYSETITVEHLVQHSSGIIDTESRLDLAGLESTNAHIPEDYMMRLIKRERDLNFSPGEKFEYSNSGYFSNESNRRADNRDVLLKLDGKECFQTS